MKLFAIAAIAVFFNILYITNASSFTDPHDHTGIVAPFTPGDPKIPLDKKALAVLGTGKPYQTQIQSATGGRGLVVQDVDAPTDIVWGRILDYDNYSKMVPKTIESKNYKVIDVKPTKKDPLSQIIFTRMKVGFPVLKLEFFIKHLYYPDLNSITWTLDYTKKSDFNDSCGFWFIAPHPDDPDRTRLFYSVEVSMFDWVPKFAVDFMSTKALTDATAWVKKFSELEYQKQGGKKDDVQSMAIDASGSVSEKKRPGKFKFWNRKGAERERQKAEEEAKRLAEEERLAAEKEAKKQIFISWTRISMASAIMVLGIYNIHLSVSR